MSNSTSPLVHPHEFLFGKDTILIDARSGSEANERYRAKHLKGALHVDLDSELSKKPTDPAYGGRHPLPDVKDFAALLGRLGITSSTSVVVYDDKNGANAAARFWWMLRAVGHTQVRVIDGGLEAIIREGLPTTSARHDSNTTSPYPVSDWELPTVTIDDVKVAAKEPEALIIDAREAYRYRGESEPIDLIAGHIPGAVNIPYLSNLKEDGQFRSAEELATLYNNAIGDREPSNVIVHCGSGVTACHTLLALEQAGIKGANLYVGSWSEWSRRDLPIGTGD